jgi:hypothetical protein
MGPNLRLSGLAMMDNIMSPARANGRENRSNTVGRDMRDPDIIEVD